MRAIFRVCLYGLTLLYNMLYFLVANATLKYMSNRVNTENEGIGVSCRSIFQVSRMRPANFSYSLHC
jgi:hypothetical protein